MNIMDMFRTAPTQTPGANPTAPTGANQPGQPLPGTQQSAQTGNNGVVPTQSNQQTNPPAPLAEYKDVWQTVANPADSTSGPMFNNVDPQKMMDAAGKVDFTKAITPEQMQAIAAGGEGAVQAFAQSMNKVAQTVFAQSAMATTKIVDQAVARAQDSFQQQLPSMVRKLSVNEGLQTANPHLSNPALTPLVSALTEQLVRKNPSATSTEIQSQVNDYFSAVGTMFAPAPVQTPAQVAAGKEDNWEKFFSQ